MSRVMMLPPKPSFWSSFLERFNPNQIGQGAMMGMEEKRRREGLAAKVLQAVAENQIPLELIGTPEGQAMIKNLKIENMPGIQELLNGARQAATMRFPERQVTAPSGGMAEQPGAGPMPGPPPSPFPATPMLKGGPDTGPAMSIPAGQRPMTLPEAQVAAGQREFGIKMGQKEYENAMETRKYETQKQIDLFYKQLGEKTPQQTVSWIREAMDTAKAAGLDVEGINYEGVTAAGPHREEGRGLEKQRLSDEQYRSYQTAVKDAVNFKFAGAKYLADLRTGKSTALVMLNFAAAGTDAEAVAQGQYIADPQKRYQFMFSMINRGIEDHNKVVSDTERQYRLRPTKPIEPINDKLLGELANVEAKTGKSFSEFVDGLGIGKLFEKAKGMFSGPVQNPTQPAVPQVPAAQETIIVNPVTKERRKLVNGQWIKI